MTRIRLAVVICVFGAVVCGCRTICSGGRSSVEPEITQEKLQQYEKGMHLTFPASTRGLYAQEVRGGNDDMVYLKVEMQKEDLDSFLTSSPFARVDLRSDRNFVERDSIQPDWTPDKVKTYKSGQVRLPGAEVLNILIDLDQEKQVVVYLEWYET